VSVCVVCVCIVCAHECVCVRTCVCIVCSHSCEHAHFFVIYVHKCTCIHEFVSQCIAFKFFGTLCILGCTYYVWCVCNVGVKEVAITQQDLKRRKVHWDLKSGKKMQQFSLMGSQLAWQMTLSLTLKLMAALMFSKYLCVCACVSLSLLCLYYMSLFNHMSILNYNQKQKKVFFLNFILWLLYLDIYF